MRHEHYSQKVPSEIWRDIGKEGRDLLIREGKREKQRSKRARRSERKVAAREESQPSASGSHRD